MNAARLVSALLLLVAFAAGTLSDRVVRKQPVVLGGYQVLEADFHVHNFPLSASTLAPWDLVLEARRQGLDALAITPHNTTLAGKVGQRFASLAGGPTVLPGEEILGPGFHLVALGIHRTISWRLSAAAAIAEVHRQGGVAIAAHPVAQSWPGYDAEAMRTLDAAEVLQPIAYSRPIAAVELQQFYARGHLTAIGSSDFHGPGPLGICRTYVFARENTEAAILEALRAGRTLVFDRGRVYGDPAMMRLANDGHLTGPVPSQDGFMAGLSRVCAVLGLLAAILFGFQSPSRGRHPTP